MRLTGMAAPCLPWMRSVSAYAVLDMNGERLRLGAFGVGRMGQVHLERLVALHRGGEIELVAMGDRFGPTLASASRLLSELGGRDLAGIARFDDPDAMAAAARLDGVIVASRTEDHARDSLAFIRRGAPVFVEKPFANSIAEAADVCRRLADSPNRLVQVGFQRHFDAAGRTALDWIASGRIGALQQSHHVLQDKNPTPAGYQSCGITADMAIHLVFEAMSVHGFELPRSVQALRFTAPHYDDRAGEGANVVHTFCTWSDGTVAHLWGSRINSAGYDNGFKVIGTEGRIDVGEFVGDFGTITARLWSGAGEDRGRQVEEAAFPMTRPSARHPDFYARYAAAYAAEISAFIDCLRKQAPFDLGSELGWKTLLVANLAEASSRSGGRRFDLMRTDGSAIASVDDAVAYAGEVSSLV
jgi:myo-inositol 2-dehydrogenase/D-chiro-inositol 1-dehydrogenase